MKKFLAVFLALLMIVGCCAALSSCGKKNTIKIGLSGPLTGANAVYGKAVENAAKLAAKEINEKGGLNGIELEIIAMDDQADPANVAVNYADMLAKGMQVSLGCVTSGACLEFTKLSKEDNVFFMTPSATNDDVPAEANGYQMCFSDNNQGTAAAGYVNQLYAEGKISEIGILYRSGDAYSEGIRTKFLASLNNDIQYVEAHFEGENPTDLTAQVQTLKDCKFIFCPIYYTPASTFMLQAKGVIAADAVYYGCDGFDGIDAVEGFDISAIPQEVSMLSHFNSGAKEGAAKTFIDAYTAEYGADTLNQFGASAYDCVYAIFGAMKKAIEGGATIDHTTSASDLCEILKAQLNGGYTFSGVTGTNVTWQASGYVAKDAEYIVIKSAG